MTTPRTSRFYLLAVLSGLASLVPSAHAQVRPSHFYTFDAGSGTTAVDSGTVGGANATLSGATWSTNVPKPYSGNNAATASTTSITAPTFSLAPQTTISLWAYWSGTTGTPQYLLDSSSAGQRTLVYFDTAGSASPLVAFGGSFFGNAFTQPTTAGWQNIVLARNATTLKVYQNGVLKTTNTLGTAAAINPGSWFFGQRNSSTERLQGEIDEYAFWNQELTAGQISTLYTQGTSVLANAPEPGTLAFLALGGTLVLVKRRRK